MAEQVIVSVYRTAEHGDSYRSAYTIQFFNRTALISALSGKFTRACHLELEAYFILRGIRRVQFLRKKRGELRLVERAIYE